MILVRVQFENNDSNTFTKKFKQTIAVMNLIAMAQFFEAIYISIFKHFLAARSIKKELLRLVSTYYGMIEINGQEMLYLSYII